MIKKLQKTCLSLVLVLTLAVLPCKVSLAQETSLNSIISQAETSSEKTGYAAVKELAESKAAALVSYYGTTSVQYALIDNGTITISGQAGVYSLESDIPLTAEHMYGIGSISKMFTTTAVMQLAEEGKIDLDKAVTTYIPEFSMADERYKDITVRMLLNHSSGLLGSSLENALLFQDKDFSTYENLLEKLKDSRLKADPGAFSVYCNDGFTLAEILVERVSGISFTDYIKKHITNPLGLTNTKTAAETFPSQNLVKTYFPGSTFSLPKDSLNMIGTGGIYSTAEELCRFAEIFMHQYTSDVLLPSSARRMEYPEYARGIWPQEGVSLLNFGLGWDSVAVYPFDEYDIKAVVKGGDTNLYHGSLVVLPEENMAVAILSSGGASIYNQIMGQEILLKALEEKGVIDEIKPDKTFTPPVQTEVPDSLFKYEGIYAQGSTLIEVDLDKTGILTLTDILTSASEKFLYNGDGKFYYPDGSAYYSFQEERNGYTYLYVNGYSSLPGIGQLADSGYAGQKVYNNPISSEVMEAWLERLAEPYFVINEKYSSQLYPMIIPAFPLMISDKIQGYVYSSEIVDEFTSRTNIEIPGASGRDLVDYIFFEKDGTEYLNAGGRIAISGKNTENLPDTKTFTANIGEDGYALWYKIGENTANKTIRVILTSNISFAVYQPDGTCVNFSYLTKDPVVTLPENGYIVFAGDADSVIRVRYVD